MKFCRQCGKQLPDEALFCSYCGFSTQPQSENPHSHTQSAGVQGTDSMVIKLSERIKINSIIWVVIAILQIIIGIILNWIFLIVGVLNIVTAVRDYNYSKQILASPVGIVKNAEPLVIPIVTLVYNAVIGGIIGVAGSIYYLIAIRNFVMENKNYFLEIEMKHTANV